MQQHSHPNDGYSELAHCDDNENHYGTDTSKRYSVKTYFCCSPSYLST